MENNPLIFVDDEKVKGYDVDMFQRATIPSMVFKMHESAMQHVLKVGVSAKELAPRKLAWVLHQQYFEFFRQPDLGEALRVTTYPTGLERIFTFRDFKLLDQKNQILAQASSSWILMNTETRKMSKYPEDIESLLIPSNEFEKLPRPPRMKFKIENPIYEKEFHVGFHDLDFNEHLSNFFYFRWMLDTLPNEFLKTKQLQSLQMRFKEECYLDDVVKVLIEKFDENTFLHVMLKNDRILAEGKTVWK